MDSIAFVTLFYDEMEHLVMSRIFQSVKPRNFVKRNNPSVPVNPDKPLPHCFSLFIHGSSLSESILQLLNVLLVDPFLAVATAATDISVDQNRRENGHAGHDIIADAICTGFSFDTKNVSTIALGTNLSDFHGNSPFLIWQRASLDARPLLDVTG